MAIIKAEVNNKNLLDIRIYSKLGKRKEFYQYDTKQRLVINCDTLNTDEVTVEFDNAKITEPFACKIYEHKGEKVCDVPDELLQGAESLKVYLSVNDEYGCKTIYEKTFNVKARDKPADYVYTPTEVERFRYLEQKIDDALKEAKDYTDNSIGDIETMIAESGVLEYDFT